MNTKQNLHTHTVYVDGKDTVEELVVEAIKRGFGSIGFSEHSYLKYSAFPCQLTPDKVALYKQEIADIKEKYRGQIDVFCGLEYDFYSDVSDERFDYTIGSVHYLDCGGKIVSFDYGLAETVRYVNDNFGGDSLAFAEKYFETVSRLPERANFDIIGHFDLITKNNDKGGFLDTADKRYLDMGLSAIHALRGKIPLFEVNTGAISRGYKTSPYPAMDFLREFRALGFGAVITSDCHNKDFIDCYFEESIELLSAAGFKSRFVLTDNGFLEVGL